MGIDENNTLEIKAIGCTISTCETLLLFAPGAGPWSRVTRPRATRVGDREDPPRSMGGLHTHRQVLHHGGGTERLPTMSRKGQVPHHKFTPVKSGPCVLHMCVAQLQACNALTDGRPQSSGEPGEDGLGRARDKNIGIFRTVIHRVCRILCTCRRSLVLAHASGTFDSRRRMQAALFVQTISTPALAPSARRGAWVTSWTMVRSSTRRAMPPSF